MKPAARRSRLALVGIGNTLAGDDGVGIEVVQALEAGWAGEAAARGVEFHYLRGDLYAVADLLERADRFVFVDAVVAEPVGRIVAIDPAPAAPAPSLHQADIGTVVTSLRRLGVASPFPACEFWGVTIALPRTLGEGLSPAVAGAARALGTRLGERFLAAPGDGSLPPAGAAP
jgi:hydrogenase maturation protease